MEPTFFSYDDKIPFEKKLLVTSTKKLSQDLLEKMVLDVRKNKPKNIEKAAN